MDKPTWILAANIFSNVFVLVNLSEFPDFFDDDDLKSMGVHGHKSHFAGPPVTGRYTEHPVGYESMPMNEQYLNMNNQPANALPIHQMPPQMARPHTFKPLGRGDPRDQNIVAQMEEEDDEQIFPAPDGKKWGGNDFIDLDALPERLSKTNKWDEFKALAAEEGEKYEGTIMKNWEDDAHMWAGYSRQLLKRDEREKQKHAPPPRPPPPLDAPDARNPSMGLDAYWSENELPQGQGGGMGPFASMGPAGGMGTFDGMGVDGMGGMGSFGSGAMGQGGGIMSGGPNPRLGPMQGMGPGRGMALTGGMGPGGGEVSGSGMGPGRVKDLGGYMGPVGEEENPFAGMGPADVMGSRGALGEAGRMGSALRMGPSGRMGPAGRMGPNGRMGPVGRTGPARVRKPPMMWMRRQFNDDVDLNFGDDYNNPATFDDSDKYPPMYYNGNKRNKAPHRAGDVQRGPLEPSEYDSFAERLRSLPGFDQAPPAPDFNPSMMADQVPGYKSGKKPGPGSERDFPNGYRPFGNDNPNDYPEMNSPDAMISKMNRELQRSAKKFPLDQGMAPKPNPGRYPQARPPRPTTGEDYPSPDDYAVPAFGQDYDNSPRSGLRMGPDRPRQPGPGSEVDFPNGFQPSVAGENMGLPSAPVRGGRPLPRLKAPDEGMSANMAELPGYHPPGMPRMQPSEAISFNAPPQRMPQGRGQGNFPDYQAGGSPDFQENGFKPMNKGIPSGYTLMKIAKQRLAAQNRKDKLAKPKINVVTTAKPSEREELLKKLQKVDDFGAPVLWVPFNSIDTRDGLARLTDKKTHKNQQFVIDGQLYVPIVDERMSRLGWTTESYVETTTDAPIRVLDESAIQIVMRTMNLNHTTEREWLAYETVIGSKVLYDNECDGQSCQARCYKTGCDALCKGDTCATGCVAGSCNAVCKGPGCFSMCIGDHCTAKCEGLNCETRCWGKSCDASCRLMSCAYTMNGGITHVSNATWDQMYPQYDFRYGDVDVNTKQHSTLGPPQHDDYPEYPS